MAISRRAMRQLWDVRQLGPMESGLFPLSSTARPSLTWSCPVYITALETYFAVLCARSNRDVSIYPRIAVFPSWQAYSNI